MPSLRPRIVGGDIRVSDGRISAAAGTGKDGVISAITKWIPVEVIAFCQGITIPFGRQPRAWTVVCNPVWDGRDGVVDCFRHQEYPG
jgi:hypothetical protein